MDEGPRTTGRYTITGYFRPQRPSSVSLTRASTTFYGIAATGSYVKFNSLRAAPPEGEAFSLTFPTGEGGPPQRWMRGLGRQGATQLPGAPAHYAPPQSGLRPASSPVGEAFSNLLQIPYIPELSHFTLGVYDTSRKPKSKQRKILGGQK